MEDAWMPLFLNNSQKDLHIFRSFYNKVLPFNGVENI